MITIVIPTKNEEKNLPKCLKSVSGFQHVVIVDSQSQDNTRDIALESGAALVNFCWNGKYPKKRNWLLRNYEFKTDWVLFLDADEVVTPSFIEEVERELSKTQKSGYWIRYNNYFQDTLLRFGIPFRKLALFKIGSGEYEKIEESHWSQLDMEIHEHPVINGDVGEIHAPLIHEDYKNLHHFLARHNEYSSWEAQRFLNLRSDTNITLTSRQKKKYRYLDKIWWAPLYFFVNYFIKLGFLDGRNGMKYSLMKAIYFFETRCKIIELKKKTNPLSF